MTPIDDRITAWLVELERELAGDDPALRHDAMSDAREHLVSAREELGSDASDDDVRGLLDEYGDPREVADSYRDAERLLHGEAPTARIAVPAAAPSVADAEPVEPRTPGRTPSWFGVVRDANAWSAVVYMLLALPLGIAWFTWTVTGGAVSGSLLVLIVGIPLLLAFLASIRGIALLDGRIVETLLGERMPRRSRTGDVDATGIVDRLKYWVTDRRTWSSIVYLLTMLPLGIAYFTVAVTLAAVGASLLASPVLLLFATNAGDVTVQGWMWPIALLYVPAGALALVGLLHLARAVGAMHGAYAKAMLVDGDGASSRRDPVSVAGSLGRAGAVLVLALVLTAVGWGVGTAIFRSTAELTKQTADLSGVEQLVLESDDGDVRVQVDDSLEAGEVRVETQARVIDDSDAGDLLRVEEGERATVTLVCANSILFYDACQTVVVSVAPGDELELVARLGSGDIELQAGSFAELVAHTGSGDVEGLVDAPRVDLRTGSGDVDVHLTDRVEQLDIEAGSGDVDVEAPGTWDVDVDTGSGDEDVSVPTGEDRRMTIRTGSGDVEVEPGAGGFDED